MYKILISQKEALLSTTAQVTLYTSNQDTQFLQKLICNSQLQYDSTYAFICHIW